MGKPNKPGGSTSKRSGNIQKKEAKHNQHLQSLDSSKMKDDLNLSSNDEEKIKNEKKIFSEEGIKGDKKTLEASKKKSFMIFFWLLGMAMLVLMGAFYWESTEEGKQMSSVSSEVSALASTQETLEVRIKNLEENQASSKLISEKISMLEKELIQSQGEMAALNGRLNAIENSAQRLISSEEEALFRRQESLDKGQTARLHQIETRILEIEKALLLRNKAGQKGLRMMQAFASLQQVLLNGNNFEDELNTFLELVNENDPALQEFIRTLKSLASTGVVTPVDLYLLFPNVADKISTLQNEAPQTFWEKTLSRIKSLVSIRRIQEDSQNQGSLDDILLKAHHMLSHGDLKRAVELLKDIDVKGQKEAEDWIRHAQKYLEVSRGLQEMEVYIFGNAFGEIKGLKTREDKNLAEGGSQ